MNLKDKVTDLKTILMYRKDQKVIFEENIKQAVLDFEKELDNIEGRIEDNIYSYTDNERFKSQRKVVREIIKKFKEIFGDWRK